MENVAGSNTEKRCVAVGGTMTVDSRNRNRCYSRTGTRGRYVNIT